MKPHERAQAARRVRSAELAADLAEHIDSTLLPMCHPWQLDGVMDPARRISLLVGRGGTKTTLMMFRAWRCLARIRDGRVIYTAESRPVAEQLMWEPLKTACEWFGLEIGEHVHFHESKMTMTLLATGATIRLVGVDDKGEVNKLRGQPFHLALIDEGSVYPPDLLDELIDRVIDPRLVGPLILGGTPSPSQRGRFYDVTRPSSDHHRPYSDRDKPEYANWLGWSSHSWELGDIVALPDAATKYPTLVQLRAEHLIKKESNKWGDDHPVWLREYRGKWALDNTETVFRFRAHVDGKPWNEWDPLEGETGGTLLAMKRAIAALPAEFKEWRFVYAGDMGSKDPFALNVFAFAPADGQRRIWHVFGFEQVRMHAEPIATMLLGAGHSTDRPEGLFGVTRWPDASVIDSDLATIDELQNVYGVRFVRSERARDYKFGAIELVNGDLVEGRIFILKGSPLYAQVQELQWREDQFGNLRENKAQANHSTDCLVIGRKAIAALFESGAVEVAPTKKLADKAEVPAFVNPEPRGEFDDIVGGDSFDDMLDDGLGNYFTAPRRR